MPIVRRRTSTFRPIQTGPVEQAIGAMIRERREELKLTQAVLADRVGLLPQQIQRIERGEAALRVQTLMDIAAALGVDAGWFLPPAATANGGPDVSVLGDTLRLVRALGRISRRDVRAALVTLAESHCDFLPSLAADGGAPHPRPANGAPPPPSAPLTPRAEAANSGSMDAP